MVLDSYLTPYKILWNGSYVTDIRPKAAKILENIGQNFTEK